MQINEIKEKLLRVRLFIQKEGYTGVLLTSNENFYWISGGKSAFVDKSTTNAAVKIYITEQKQYVVCNSSEMFRVMEEELAGCEFELVSYMWHESEEKVLKSLFGCEKVASDNGIYDTDNRSIDIQKLRYMLTDSEFERYCEIGPEAAKIVQQCCRKIQIGESENNITAHTVQRFMEQGYQVPVCLVAADERLLKYRHPIPKFNTVKKYAMIAVCVQKYGLVVSMSRIVCFGKLDKEICRKYEALLKIDAAYILNTIEGACTGEIVKKAHDCYAKTGYEKDFHLHHQGGGLGYLTRDYCASEECSEVVHHNQAFSWNPTIAGTKLEDTYIIRGNTQKIISQTEDWPLCDVTIPEGTVKRPMILLR